MDIFMVWVTDSSGVYWLESAWDDDSVMENHEGWTEAKENAYETHGPDNVRIIKTTVDLGAVIAAFQPTHVGSQ